MRCSPLITTVLAAVLAGAVGGCGAHRSGPRPFSFFSGKPVPAATGAASKRTHNLALRLQLSPVPLALSDNRRVDVRIVLENIASKFVQLEFPTTQRFEILVKDETGRILEKWSEDRLFEPTPGYVGINPGEHVEYNANVATRDMHAGTRYVVEGFFPGFPELKAAAAIVPQN